MGADVGPEEPALLEEQLLKGLGVEGPAVLDGGEQVIDHSHIVFSQEAEAVYGDHSVQVEKSVLLGDAELLPRKRGRCLLIVADRTVALVDQVDIAIVAPDEAEALEAAEGDLLLVQPAGLFVDAPLFCGCEGVSEPEDRLAMPAMVYLRLLAGRLCEIHCAAYPGLRSAADGEACWVF